VNFYVETSTIPVKVCLILVMDQLSHMDTLKLVIDAGMVVLIWIVQLVIYPGFCYYSESDIKRWHKIYTSKITIVVLPMMLSQLMLHGLSSYVEPSIINIGNLILVIILWLITFLVAVPLHQDIDTKENSTVSRMKLVKINWSRTLLWTLILIISIYQYGK
jgi:hypothetical protein